MTFPQPYEYELRVLVLAPFGRDGQLTCEVLHDAGINGVNCQDLDELADQLAVGAGAVMLTSEALHPASIAVLTRTLGKQPAWSDIPLVLATSSSSQARTARESLLRALEPAGHITLLERPIRVPTLVSVVRSALNTRRRQYEMRDLIEELRLSIERLDAEHGVRERFINLLAHDLRGPLMVSRMTAQMLVARPGNHQQVSKFAGRIEKSVDRADSMIRNMLDAHRLRAGQRLSVDRQWCDLMEIARDVIEDLSAIESARPILQGPEQLEGYWDADLLRRALWNLVTNAVKHGAPDSAVEIAAGQSGNTAWLRVHNWGPSIPPEEQQQLFEPFARMHSTEADEQRGWGLGLTLVQGVAASHEGTLEVSSDPDSGTTFTMRIPLDPQP